MKNVRKTGDIQDPGKLDLAPLAAKYNFPIDDTPLVDQFEVAKYEIGQKVQQFDMASCAVMRQFRFLSFAEIAFSQDQPLYKPEEVRSSEPDVSYIYFRTAEEKPADVTLKEVRPQVIEFWKKQKAFELAMIDAQKLSEKAKGARFPSRSRARCDEGRRSAGFFVDDHGQLWIWFWAAGAEHGPRHRSARARIHAGGFCPKPEDTGAAPNQAHSKAYVVSVTKQDPDDERLRMQFLESGYNNMVLMLAQGEALNTSVRWYRGIAEQYQVKWQRPPQDERRM